MSCCKRIIVRVQSTPKTLISILWLRNAFDFAPHQQNTRIRIHRQQNARNLQVKDVFFDTGFKSKCKSRHYDGISVPTKSEKTRYTIQDHVLQISLLQIQSLRYKSLLCKSSPYKQIKDVLHVDKWCLTSPFISYKMTFLFFFLERKYSEEWKDLSRRNSGDQRNDIKEQNDQRYIPPRSLDRQWTATGRKNATRENNTNIFIVLLWSEIDLASAEANGFWGKKRGRISY